MKIEIDVSDHHESMLSELREEYGEEIDDHIRQVIEAEVHESYQQLRFSDSGN